MAVLAGNTEAISSEQQPLPPVHEDNVAADEDEPATQAPTRATEAALEEVTVRRPEPSVEPTPAAQNEPETTMDPAAPTDATSTDPTNELIERNAVSAAGFFSALDWVTGRPPEQAIRPENTEGESSPPHSPAAPPQEVEKLANNLPEDAAVPVSSSNQTTTPGRGAPYAETAVIAGPFFKTVPWDGRYAPGEPIQGFSVEAAREDGQLDPRDADMPANNPLLAGMRSAAKTSDRMAGATQATEAAHGEAVAGHFFRDLPWFQN